MVPFHSSSKKPCYKVAQQMAKTKTKNHFHENSGSKPSALTRTNKFPLSPRLTRSSSSRKVVSNDPFAVSGAFILIGPTLNSRNWTSTALALVGVSAARTCRGRTMTPNDRNAQKQCAEKNRTLPSKRGSSRLKQNTRRGGTGSYRDVME